MGEKIMEVPQVQTVEKIAGASPSYYGNHCASSNDLTASTGNGNNRTDANDYYGCPHGGDLLPYDECRLLSTSDNHGNLCHGRRLCSSNDNYGWRLRAVSNHFVGQLTPSRLAGSFDYEFWRFFEPRQICILLVIRAPRMK